QPRLGQEAVADPQRVEGARGLGLRRQIEQVAGPDDPEDDTAVGQDEPEGHSGPPAHPRPPSPTPRGGEGGFGGGRRGAQGVVGMAGWPAAASAMRWSFSAGTAPLTPTAPTIRPSSTTGTPPLPNTNGAAPSAATLVAKSRRFVNRSSRSSVVERKATAAVA